MELGRVAIQDVFTLVFGINPGKDAHQRGFSGAVFTDERVGFPLAQVKIDILKRGQAPKALGDVLQFKDRAITHQAFLLHNCRIKGRGASLLAPLQSTS